MQRNQGLTVVVFASLTLLLHAQTFDVASIKRNVSGEPRSGTRTLPGGRIAVTKLGLKLESERAPVEVVVIDSVDKATED